MPTPAELRVLTELDRLQGNVGAVAKELAVSVSYVNRVKKASWKPGETTALVATQKEEKSVELIKALLPPNIQAVGKLRDDTLADLNNSLPDLSAKVKVYLLNTILRYETNLRAALTPAMQVLQDNRSINIGTLVDRLAGLDPADLRALAGVPEQEIMEGEFTSVKEN